jgi:hypothetical protein
VFNVLIRECPLVFILCDSDKSVIFIVAFLVLSYLLIRVKDGRIYICEKLECIINNQRNTNEYKTLILKYYFIVS